jgi:hypothetical protein
MKINISQILEYQRCPVSWYNKYQLKRGPAPGVALSDGLYFHALCEAYYKELELLPPSEGTQQDAMRAFVEEGNLPKFNIIDVERVIEMPLGAHVLVGTLDGIIYDGSGYQSLQWKTCSGGFDLERQCDAVQYSYHECAYEAMMNYIGYPC